MPRLPLLPLLLPLLTTLGDAAPPTPQLPVDAGNAPLDSGSPPQHPQPSQGPLPVLFARLGASVNLSCNTSARHVTWRVPPAGGWAPPPSGGPPPSAVSIVGPPVLVLQAVSAAHAGSYECQEPGSEARLFALQLKVGEPPAKPQLHCRSRRYPDSFSCSWRVPPTGGHPDSIDIKYSHPSLPGELPCRPEPPPAGDPSEDLAAGPAAGTCVVNDPILFSTHPYHVRASASNAYGRGATTTVWFLLHSIVKPDPPEGVAVTPVPGQPRRLLVSWRMPASWPNQPGFTLHYTVRARHPHHRAWRVLREDVEELEVMTEAATPLLVEVAASDCLVGNLSEWSGAAWSPRVVTTTPSVAEMLTTSASEEWDFFTTTGPLHLTNLFYSNVAVVAAFLSFLLLVTAAGLLCVCRRRLRFLALRFSRKGGSAVGGPEIPPCSTPLEGPTCAGGLGYRALKTPSGPEH